MCKKVSTWMCLTQTVSSARNTEQIIGGGDINGINEAVVRTCVQSTVIVNLNLLPRYLSSNACCASVLNLILTEIIEIRT